MVSSKFKHVFYKEQYVFAAVGKRERTGRMFTRKSAAHYMVTISIGVTLSVMSGFKTTDGKNVYVLLAFRTGVIFCVFHRQANTGESEASACEGRSARNSRFALASLMLLFA